MSSIQELIGEVHSIKTLSDQLSSMVGEANVSLSSQSMVIANLVRGSSSGQEAVMALSIAARSLSNAASSMKGLSRTCDDCISNLAG